MKYPFQEKITELLELKNETRDWLAEQIGVNRRTTYNMEFGSTGLDTIIMLSYALEFDFLKDYSAWREQHELAPLSVVNEPPYEYKKREDNISVTLKITGTPTAFGKGFIKLLKTIKNEGEKEGFAIE